MGRSKVPNDDPQRGQPFSVETIKQELDKLKHNEVRVKVIHAAVGQVTTTDVHLAEAAGGIVVGFHVGIDNKARDLADRMIRLFTRGPDGRRPVFGGADKFQEDPHWRDYLLFYEYFHGDNGAGLGASHQTGWTALVASLIDEWRRR